MTSKLMRKIRGLPRIRGGVSRGLCRAGEGAWSSPHTRGCFSMIDTDDQRRAVFPAYAGVFRTSAGFDFVWKRLPRIRGGVSEGSAGDRRRRRSSPHTRGCFLFRQASAPRRAVFPAYAGVFLSITGSLATAMGLPRIRGGVSTIGYSRIRAWWSSPHTRGCF